MATLLDLLNRQLEAGDSIILKASEAHVFDITEIGQVAINVGPGMPPMRQLRMVGTVTMTFPDGMPQIPVYLVKKGEKKMSGAEN